MAAYLHAPSVFASLPWIKHGFGTRFTAEVPADLVVLKQIHSNLVLLAEKSGFCGEGDALATDRPGLAVSVRTADCYPILLADARTRAVAAVHAGWRGTITHIVERVLEKMGSQFGTATGDVHAAIGPGIGRCCYEVGRDVAGAFGCEGTHLDLERENWKQLVAAGVAPENIEALGVCTYCDAERFFSYRREKEQAGRMISYISILKR